MDEHYKLVIEKTKPLVGVVDGDDISDLWAIIDDWNYEYSESPNYSILLDELACIKNSMCCEHGSDYGSLHKWNFSSPISQELIEKYDNGKYKGSEKDLDDLINLIIKHTTNQEFKLGIGNYYGSVKIVKEFNKYFLSINCEINPIQRLEISENVFYELKESVKL